MLGSGYEASSSSQSNVLMSSRTPSMDALPSGEKCIQETPDHKSSSLLTTHELLHILDESVDNSEHMGCGSPGLVLRQSVEPL